MSVYNTPSSELTFGVVCSNKKAGLKIEGGRALIRKNMIYSSEAEGCHISCNSMPRLEVDIFGVGVSHCL